MITYTSDLQFYKSLSFKQKLSTRLAIPILAKIVVQENLDPLIDIREKDTEKLLHFTSAIPNFFIRESFAKKIIMIARQAKKLGFLLEIHELYRDIRKQAREFFEIERAFKSLHPELSSEEIYKKTTGFIADPFMIPPHCTGGAIDVILIDRGTHIPLDMGAPINTAHEISHILSPDLTKEQISNRTILRTLFIEQECAPLPTEWWHFSYGERYWAAFYDKVPFFDQVSLNTYNSLVRAPDL